MHLNVIRFMIRILENIKFQNATRGGNSLEENPNISSMPRWTSNSVSFHVWTFHKVCPKLGKTQIIQDVRRGMVRNTGFYD